MRLIDADKLPQQIEVYQPKNLKDAFHTPDWWFGKGVTAVWDAIKAAPTTESFDIQRFLRTATSHRDYLKRIGDSDFKVWDDVIFAIVEQIREEAANGN